MNAYDFDGTIYAGDSMIDFTIFCFCHRLRLVAYIPRMAKGIFMYCLGRMEKTRMKENYFSFLQGIDDIDRMLDSFWKKHKAKICDWYLKQKRENDVIISASPDFILKPICELLGIRCLIASEVDKNSGKFYSPNCYGEEKVVRFKQQFGEIRPDYFYTDTKSDMPMARWAKKYCMVKK